MPFRKKILQTIALSILISVLLCCGKYHVKPSQKIDPIHFKSATELTSAIRRGEISSVGLLNLYLDRIQRYNGDIHAVVALNIAAARARAVEADKALARGQTWGPLHGLPMTVKDVFEVVGMPATSGDSNLKDYIPKSNAIPVQRLIDAGAIIFGKTNVPYHAEDFQSYNDIYGITNNPWDLSKTPGGSSGGSAAALAAGFTPLELGSDLGGSIRIPASFNGVFGHKPTFGIVPRYGHIPPMPGRVPPNAMPVLPLFVVGPMARSADDLELALDVLITPGSGTKNDQNSKLLPARRQQFRDYLVAVWFTDSDPDAEVDADVLATLQKTVKRLREAGINVEEARPDINLGENLILWTQIVGKMMFGRLPLDENFVAMQKKKQAKWAKFFERYDVLLAPVSPTVAFPHDHKVPIISRTLMVNEHENSMLRGNLSWMAIATVSGLPATVAPVGLNDAGLPVGVQIIGAKFEDRTTIDFARGLSKLIGGFVAPPGY
jgi:amidase